MKVSKNWKRNIGLLVLYGLATAMGLAINEFFQDIFRRFEKKNTTLAKGVYVLFLLSVAFLVATLFNIQRSVV